MVEPPGAPEVARVHVFWLSSPLDAGQAAQVGALLTADEQARVQRWGPLPRAQHFLAGRALLHLAAQRWGLLPGWLAFDPGGRPVVQSPHPPPMDVSITHAGNHALVALAQGVRVGVDVEMVAPRQRTMLDRFFTAEEFAWAGDQLERVHLLWTAKEAALKALGTGVSGDPARVHVQPGNPWLEMLDAPPGTRAHCTTYPASDHCASVVALLPADSGQPVLEMEHVSTAALREFLNNPHSGTSS